MHHGKISIFDGNIYPWKIALFLECEMILQKFCMTSVNFSLRNLFKSFLSSFWGLFESFSNSLSFFSYSTVWDDPLALVFVNMNIKVVICDCGKTYKMSPEMARKFYENRKDGSVTTVDIFAEKNNPLAKPKEHIGRYWKRKICFTVPKILHIHHCIQMFWK